MEFARDTSLRIVEKPRINASTATSQRIIYVLTPYQLVIKSFIIIRNFKLIKSLTLKHFDTFILRNFIEEHQNLLFGKNLVVLRENNENYDLY